MINNVTGTHFNPIYILQSESLLVNWFEYSLALFQVCNSEWFLLNFMPLNFLHLWHTNYGKSAC